MHKHFACQIWDKWTYILIIYVCVCTLYCNISRHPGHDMMLTPLARRRILKHFNPSYWKKPASVYKAVLNKKAGESLPWARKWRHIWQKCAQEFHYIVVCVQCWPLCTAVCPMLADTAAALYCSVFNAGQYSSSTVLQCVQCWQIQQQHCTAVCPMLANTGAALYCGVSSAGQYSSSTVLQCVQCWPIEQQVPY